MSDGMMEQKPRIWHASRDAYHCAFRFLRLLSAASTNRMEFERLRVLDMFLLYPSLLHEMSMPRAVKEHFRTLDVPTPADTFIRLPSAASIFQDLRIFQNTATAYLIARGIFVREAFAQGLAEADFKTLPAKLMSRIGERNKQEVALAAFLADGLSVLPIGGADGLYRKVGLPVRQLSV